MIRVSKNLKNLADTCMAFLLSTALIALAQSPSLAAQWCVAPTGNAGGQGSKEAPWDLASAFAGQHDVAPGDTVWISAGTYRHPDRKLGSPGYVVRLAGQEGKPIHVRARPGERVTIDGGVTVQQPASYLWLRDLEIIVSENFSMSRKLSEPGSHPKSYNRPWGGLNIHGGKGCKYINLVIHHNAQGVSFWKGATDSELYGCVVYDNGWQAPDRGHGHAIYTQNKDGVKVISNCILTGGFGYTMHAYGSSRAYVDNYLVEENVCYNGGRFLIGGGRPSRGIRVRKNYTHGLDVQLGYSAPHNEDCEVRDNVIVNGSLDIKNYRKVEKRGNLVLARQDPRPPDSPVRIEFLPNRYDPHRAHLVIYNWARKGRLKIQLSPSFFKPGDRYRLLQPRDFFGKPVVAGVFDGKSVLVPAQGEFTALVVLRQPAP